MGDLGHLVVHFDQRIIRDPQICGGDRSSKERGSRYVPCLQALRPEKHPRRSWLIFDAGKRPIPRLLFGNDLCRLPGWGQLGQRRSGDAAVLDDEVLQVSARRAAAGISWRPEREGLVSSTGPGPTRLRLDPMSYEEQRQQVLRRDGWRCQSCGTMSNLEVHRKEFRSHAGEDSELNLIPLCATCHASAHGT